MLSTAIDRLNKRLAKLRFSPPVTHIYNPNVYARAPLDMYLRKYGIQPREVLMLGMNPGPWGMAQTGVPFGDVSIARDWLKVEAPVKKPKREHPKRPIDGYACERSEVSGARLWGWARATYGQPEKFFARFFVWNYCPLVFMEDGGKNVTPDKLPAAEAAPLYAACDEMLLAVVAHFQPRIIVGVGAFAQMRAQLVCPEVKSGRILHPSPASPLANKDWAGTAAKQLETLLR